MMRELLDVYKGYWESLDAEFGVCGRIDDGVVNGDDGAVLWDMVNRLVLAAEEGEGK